MWVVAISFAVDDIYALDYFTVSADGKKNMPILWQAVADYLAPIALGGAGAFATFIALLPSKLGERLVGHYFEKSLASMKHEQSIELGKLQSGLDYLRDRGTRSNEREYQAIQESWERFVEAYRATTAAIIQFYSFPDLDSMSTEDIISFLDANEIVDRSKNNILQSTEKKRAFTNYLRVKSINNAASEIEIMRDVLSKQSVFMPSVLYLKFDGMLDTLHGAWVEQSMSFEHQSRAEQTDSRLVIGSKGKAMHDDLRDAVRARLLREV